MALFVRRDPLDRFVSCLVFVPRDRYDTTLRERFRDILQAAWHGTVTSITGSGSTDQRARPGALHVSSTSADSPTADLGALEQRLADAGRSWTDRVREAP